jgi:hypothetical protein
MRKKCKYSISITLKRFFRDISSRIRIFPEEAIRRNIEPIYHVRYISLYDF